MPGSTVLMKPNSSGKTLFADVILRAVGKAFRDDLKASSRRRQTENDLWQTPADAAPRCLVPRIPGALLEIPCHPGDGVGL